MIRKLFLSLAFGGFTAVVVGGGLQRLFMALPTDKAAVAGLVAGAIVFVYGILTIPKAKNRSGKAAPLPRGGDQPVRGPSVRDYEMNKAGIGNVHDRPPD